ncbi:MAG: hypothetical protein ACI4QI_08710 [Candidatus Coproplasma sp.]
MEGKTKKNRKSSGSSSVAVGIISFILGFVFAIIVLIGSIFGVGYVVVTTPMDDVFSVLGLNNKNDNYDESDPDSDKYNYINSDQAPNILALIQEVIAMANSGLGEISVDKIDALAPITDTVLDMVYEYIDEVVDFDKDTFRNVSLVSILDTLTTSVYYIRTAKIIDLLNDKMGYNIELDDIPVVPNLIKGTEAQYATVTGTDLKLPVLFDYYVKDEGGIGYSRTEPVNGSYAYPTGLSDEFITETMGKDEDNKTLYKVYYVPCKISGTSVTEAEYILTPLTQTNESVYYTDEEGVKHYLHYTFRTIEYGEDTVFVAVKPQKVDGTETFVLDPATIDRSCMYFGDYARKYHNGVQKRTENDAMYGVKTVNGINYFKDSKGNVIDYDPLTVSDLMLDPIETLNSVYLSDLLTDFVGEGNTDMFNEVLEGITLGNVLKGNVDFDEVIKDIKISTFLNEVQADDTIMTFIVYNISDVKNVGGVYTAIYDKGGDNEKTVTLEVDASGVIKSMKDGSGKAVYGNTVRDLNTITDGLTLDIFLDVKADDAIMAYLGYGISDVVEVSDKDWQYEGKDTNDNTVRIYTDDDGYITKVTDTEGNTVKGTTIDEVSDRIDGIMDVIAVPDLLDINPEEEIMAYLGYGIYDVTEKSGTHNGNAYTHVAKYKDNGTEIAVYVYAEGDVIKSVWKDDGTTISGTKANDISGLLDNVDQALRISDFIDMEVDNAIMSYIGYGVYGVTATDGINNGKAYTHTGTIEVEGVEKTVYIATDGDIITAVWDEDNNTVEGTKIGDITAKFDNLYDKLKIEELITINSDSKLINAIKGSTVNELEDKINELTIGEVIDVDPNDSLVAYLAYGVYDIVAESGEGYTHTGLYDVEGVATKVYIATEIKDGNPVITSIWYGDNVEVVGTKINEVTDILDNVADVMAVTEFMDVKPTDAIMAYTGYGINGLVAGDGTDSLGNDYNYKGMYGTYECYLTVDGNGNIDSVWYIDGGVKKAVSGTKIGEIPDRISSLQDTLTIGEIVAVDSDSSKILQALENTPINGLDTKIKSLTVEDVLTEDQITNNSVLPQLRDTLVIDLGSEIDKVLIQRIYAKEVYELAEDGDPTDNSTYNSAYLYYEKVGNETDGYKYVIVDINCQDYEEGTTDYDNALGKLTEEQFIAGAGKYYTYGEAKGMWKLVLYRMESDGTKTEKAYTLNNLDYMVNSCSDVVYNSTLNELKAAGIIGDTVNLDKTIKTVDTVTPVDTSDPLNPTINYKYVTIVDGNIALTDNSGDAKTMGELSLKQLLTAITMYL